MKLALPLKIMPLLTIVTHVLHKFYTDTLKHVQPTLSLVNKIHNIIYHSPAYPVQSSCIASYNSHATCYPYQCRVKTPFFSCCTGPSLCMPRVSIH